MTEDSILWTTSGTGDGASAGYTQTELIRWLRQSFISDNTDEGVANNYLNELEVTGVATPVAVNTGAAYVYGFPYWNTASVNVAIPTPTVAVRIDRIVLRASWSAQTVRITRIAGNEGGGAPALVQSDGVTWDIPLAQTSTTVGGVITVTDQREFLHPNIEIEAGMFNADVAGDGLGISAGALEINVDDSTIEINADTLRVKAAGITNSHIADRTRTMFVPAVECYDATSPAYEECEWRGWTMIDAKECRAFGHFRCPADYSSAMTVNAIMDSLANGDVVVQMDARWASDGEQFDTHTATQGPDTETVVAGQLDDMTTATSLAGIATGDYVQLKFTRDGTAVADTIAATMYFKGFIVSYTADM
jgi:hypothetical protein